jgi:hypothetical protein
MKPKNLRKKIQQLEKRLQQGPRKLAKLKQKLQKAEAAKVKKTRKKSAARARSARLQSKSPSRPADAKKPATAKKVKRKLNLSPERRAQLAAAMKARWAAKRAAEAKTPSSDNQYSPPGPSPHAPENRPDGV